MSRLRARDSISFPEYLPLAGTQMAELRRAVTEFIRAGQGLLALQDLTDEEVEAIRDIVWLLVLRFPDEGDDGAD